jgi:class 3 adenylate cyclase
VALGNRMAWLTRKYETDILISSEVKEGLDDRFQLRELAPLEVKGKAEKIKTFEVQKFREQSAD